MSTGKIVDAYAEWDDPYAFRVYLIREVVKSTDGEEYTDLDEGTPMEAAYDFGDECETIEARLYRAAIVKCIKDFVGRPADERKLGWPKKGPAERVARAVKAELARIEKGEPGPTKDAIRFALMFVPRKRGSR